MNEKWAVVQKKVGETPLAAIEAWRAAHNISKDTPLAYAGRLDPMASGTLLILIGDECKKQTAYTHLDKEYSTEIILDLHTDTGDLLGIPTLSQQQTILNQKTLEKILEEERGTHTHHYPVYSSKPVNGKPLFMYALEGTLDTIDIPTHEETFYRITSERPYTLSGNDLCQRITQTLEKTPKAPEASKALGADFRIDEISAAYSELFPQIASRSFTVLPLHAIVSSGTYMRTLAPRIGEHLGTFGAALSIHRDIIGRYIPAGPFSFWLSRYQGDSTPSQSQ